ncbi:uncharacterized protein LY89DRAFT_459580 [Mollisia scopiformis]|uniref:Uncharacterized protein n=1 Tax=Mollisia scopiformis TaxID=149040 RepID=A0A194XHW2_MOLSC|nr:uncharacterized protein LY89DRAFT_459580 [Mollisia scopiformis]KUJ19748.1 hypothetical protein LY89DRAFT_459580 [Mollisia scopiformis]
MHERFFEQIGRPPNDSNHVLSDPHAERLGRRPRSADLSVIHSLSANLEVGPLGRKKLEPQSWISCWFPFVAIANEAEVLRLTSASPGLGCQDLFIYSCSAFVDISSSLAQKRIQTVVFAGKANLIAELANDSTQVSVPTTFFKALQLVELFSLMGIDSKFMICSIPHACILSDKST